jgi:predicted small lipoprotein YifL
MMRFLILLAAMATLAACGEKPQALGSPKSDAPAYAGTGSSFTVPGWKAGDKTGWEQHLKTRQQNSQNDYSRMN